jgi:hypothetical protein
MEHIIEALSASAGRSCQRSELSASAGQSYLPPRIVAALRLELLLSEGR